MLDSAGQCLALSRGACRPGEMEHGSSGDDVDGAGRGKLSTLAKTKASAVTYRMRDSRPSLSLSVSLADPLSVLGIRRVSYRASLVRAMMMFHSLYPVIELAAGDGIAYN